MAEHGGSVCQAWGSLLCDVTSCLFGTGKELSLWRPLNKDAGIAGEGEGERVGRGGLDKL